MDFEAFLRKLIKEDAAFRVFLGTNNEGRVLVTFDNEGVGLGAFLVVENTIHPVLPKPTPQRVVAEGFDAHKGMGEK